VITYQKPVFDPKKMTPAVPVAPVLKPGQKAVVVIALLAKGWHLKRKGEHGNAALFIDCIYDADVFAKRHCFWGVGVVPGYPRKKDGHVFLSMLVQRVGLNRLVHNASGGVQ
jgi:hypothetical protein